MSLKEKIESMTPELREKVEDYIDYLLSRNPPDDLLNAEPDKPIFQETVPEMKVVQPVPRNDLKIPGKKDPSGIILAEEIPRKKDDMDAIDFADINTRFAKTADDSDDSVPRRSKRMFDWL